MRQRLVVVGNGMAAGRAMERLSAIAPDRYDIVVFNAPPGWNELSCWVRMFGSATSEGT